MLFGATLREGWVDGKGGWQQRKWAEGQWKWSGRKGQETLWRENPRDSVVENTTAY